ncbi:MAG: cytochrome d ubiquinol oxidase subunit II [Betaproteobacteria bacterium]|nr:cytochrome d ubiquinol oxidase subunit II [Betaproteobacteria bacterium]
MTLDLPVVFAVLMGVVVLAYVVLDGYDLGVGMLLPAADPREQNVMVSSIGPFWDANETWLVLGVALLLAQGLMLGSYITGFAPGFGYALLSLVVAGGLCGGYVLLRATWLILRTEGALQRKAVAWARWGLLWVALGVALVSIATPLASESVRDKWFDFPRTLGLMLLPLASLAAWLWVWRISGRIRKGEAVPDWAPFAGTIAIYALAFLGLPYSLFPYLVMDRITIWEAAAHPSSLKLVLIGALIVLPFIIGWTAYVYRVFRGKATGTLYDH